MRKLIYVLIFGVSAITLNSCDWFDDVTTKDINFTTDLSFDAHVNQEVEGEFEETITFDASENEEIRRYKDDVKKIEVLGLSYKVSQLNTDHEELIFNGKLEYKIGAGPKLPLAELNNVDIKALAASGEETDLDIPSNILTVLMETFESYNKVTIFVTGTLSEVPADFHMEIKTDLKVTAEVEI